MIISTTEVIPDKTVSDILGVVSGNVVRSKHLGRDIAAGLKSLIGGEIRGYSEMLSDARSEAVQRMLQKAQSMQADAVINIRFTTSAIAQGMSEILVYGTAVKLR